MERDTSGLVPIDFMFGGFKCINLVIKQFEYFNGFRITMMQPSYPVKFGAYIETSLKEYEHFVGHLVDTSSEPRLVTYEIPVALMMNNAIDTGVVSPSVEDNFTCKGVSMFMECSK
jgi:hypothetical protein